MSVGGWVGGWGGVGADTGARRAAPCCGGLQRPAANPRAEPLPAGAEMAAAAPGCPVGAGWIGVDGWGGQIGRGGSSPSGCSTAVLGSCPPARAAHHQLLAGLHP
jgi:hypothetical protein